MAGLAHRFWGWCGISMMADRGHHGECEHDKRDVAMPAMPGTGFVVVETEFVLGGLEAVFDRPTMPFHPDQRFDRGALRAPCREESEVAVGDVAMGTIIGEEPVQKGSNSKK